MNACMNDQISACMRICMYLCKYGSCLCTRIHGMVMRSCACSLCMFQYELM